MMHMLFDIELMGAASDFLLSVRNEIFLFLAALAMHFLLFRGWAQRKPTAKSAKAKAQEWGGDDAAHPGARPLAAAGPEDIGKAFDAAFQRRDHRRALRCWAAARKCGAPPPIPLAHLVETMQCLKKENSLIVCELQAHLQRHAGGGGGAGPVNELLEALARRGDLDLAEKLFRALPGAGLKPDARTYEALLGMHLAARSHAGMRGLIDEMGAQHVPFTARSKVAVIKMALREGDLGEAVQHFRELKGTWLVGGPGSAPTPSPAPQNLVAQLVELACREHQLALFLPELEGAPLASEEVVRVMLDECVRQKDAGLLAKVEQAARRQGACFSEGAYSLLIQGFSGNAARVEELFDEVLANFSGLATDTAFSVLASCGQTKNLALASRLFARVSTRHAPLLSAFIRFYVEAGHYEKACDIYERDLGWQRVPGGPDGQCRPPLDARTEQGVMDAALRCGRDHLARKLLDASPSNVSQHIAMIRKCGSQGKLGDCMKIFESLEQSGTELNSVVYNTILDACVQCRDLGAAESWMREMKERGMADIVSHNTLMKGHLQNSDFERAWAVMKDAKSAGLQPNQVSFNEFVNAVVMSKGRRTHRAQVWEMLGEMRAAGIQPNQVTCSILLKDLNSSSREADIVRTMDLIGSMGGAMDEVLLSSIVEACVRIGKPDLLTTTLRHLQGREGGSLSGITSAHTFGSLIKAYGCARDIDSVWRCWKEMRSRHIRPTSITLGCMVEAVVTNGDTEGAYELVHQMRADEQCRSALNTVIYCSVLKGFAREKNFARVWAVFDEMQGASVDLSVVTYNTLLDACARCGRMDQAPKVFGDMKKMGVEPNVITYSTMIKGHCQAGEVHTAFKILEDMAAVPELEPDEIMYNSLLDGCAQNGFTEEGLRLLRRMRESGVKPSNFTLSVVVKLLSRARKLDTAFRMVESISKEYGFRPNVHVLTNLIQACISSRQLQRGLGTFESMLRERVQPDGRTYAILVRACLSSKLVDRADGLVRAALGLDAAHTSSACASLDHGLVNEALVALATKCGAPGASAALLEDIRRQRPRVRIDAATERQIAAAGAGAPLRAREAPWRACKERKSI